MENSTAAYRRRAEIVLLTSEARHTKQPHSADAIALLHELEVHQIELEMQNEELRASKLELEESRRGYFELFDLAPVAYLTVDASARVQEVNQAAAILLGTTKYSLLQKSLLPFIAPDSLGEFNSFLSCVMAQASRQVCQLRMVTRAKAVIDVEIQAEATASSSVVPFQRARLVLTDIASRGQFEGQRALQQQADEPLKVNGRGPSEGAAAQALTTLLNNIIGDACLARKETPEASGVQRHLERIIASASRAAGLYNPWIDASNKGNAGNSPRPPFVP